MLHRISRLVTTAQRLWGLGLSGSTTKFLRADGTEATPLGSSDWQTIDSQDASASATIEFTGIDPDAWDELELVAMDVVSATDNVDLYLRVGTGATPTWASGASDYAFAKRGVFGASLGGTGFSATDTTFSALQFPTTGISNVAGETSYSYLRISGLPSGARLHVVGHGSTWKADNTVLLADAAGFYNATTAITGLQVLMSSGNITSGRFVLRGRPAT